MHSLAEAVNQSMDLLVIRNNFGAKESTLIIVPAFVIFSATTKVQKMVIKNGSSRWMKKNTTSDENENQHIQIAIIYSFNWHRTADSAVLTDPETNSLKKKMTKNRITTKNGNGH